MDAQRWQKIKGLFDAAVELETGKRSNFLANACSGDDELRLEVEKMLASSENIGSLMEQAAIGEVAEMFVSAENQLKVGERSNHYEIIKQIGAGGMGEVYLAKD